MKEFKCYTEPFDVNVDAPIAPEFVKGNQYLIDGVPMPAEILSKKQQVEISAEYDIRLAEWEERRRRMKIKPAKNEKPVRQASVVFQWNENGSLTTTHQLAGVSTTDLMNAMRIFEFNLLKQITAGAEAAK